MPSEFTISFQVGEVVQMIRMVEARLDDPTPLMQDVLLVLIRSTQLTFEAQGRPDRWDDLAESTERARFRKADKGRGSLAALGGMQILRDSGLLAMSLGAGASGEFTHPYGFGEADKFTAVLGTNRPGAEAHQLGYPTGNIPQRIFILFQEQDYEDIETMTMDYFLVQGPYAAA